MSVSYAFWSVLTLYLALLGKGDWTSLRVSVAAIGCDFIGAGWYFCLMEQYKNVRYIESTLRRKLKDILPNQEFWRFETQRHPITENQWVRLLGDIWAWVGIFLGSVVASYMWKPKNPFEWVALYFSFTTAVCLFVLMAITVAERRKMDRVLWAAEAQAQAARDQV